MGGAREPAAEGDPPRRGTLERRQVQAEPDVQADGHGAEDERLVPAAPPREKKRSGVQETVETLLLAVFIFIAVRSIILNYRVDGSSMEPNLHNREMLVVNRRAYSHVDLNAVLNVIPGVHRVGNWEWYPFHPVARGDIVIFNPPGEHAEPYIKRIIGLPGDHLSIHDGSVYINGQQLQEPYLQADTVWRGSSQDYVVPPGYVFVLGDNRNNSSDSRVFGAVPTSSIIGRAWVAYWPPSQAHVLHDPAYRVR